MQHQRELVLEGQHILGRKLSSISARTNIRNRYFAFLKQNRGDHMMDRTTNRGLCLKRQTVNAFISGNGTVNRRVRQAMSNSFESISSVRSTPCHSSILEHVARKLGTKVIERQLSSWSSTILWPLKKVREEVATVPVPLKGQPSRSATVIDLATGLASLPASSAAMRIGLSRVW